MLSNIAKKVMKDPVKSFWVNQKFMSGIKSAEREVFVRPVCLHTTFLLYILPIPTILLRITSGLNRKIFQREDSVYIACNDENALFTPDAVKNYNSWFVRKCVKLSSFS